MEGYITAKTFEGTCTAAIFEDFIIDQLLPLCNPYPNARSVIVLDNASVHHSRKEFLIRHVYYAAFGYSSCLHILLI